MSVVWTLLVVLALCVLAYYRRDAEAFDDAAWQDPAGKTAYVTPGVGVCSGLHEGNWYPGYFDEAVDGGRTVSFRMRGGR
jgi:hypothetical protein